MSKKTMVLVITMVHGKPWYYDVSKMWYQLSYHGTMFRITCHFYGHTVMPCFVTDRCDSVFLFYVCFEHPVKQGKNLLCFYIFSHAHIQTNQTCFPVKTHVLHTPSSVQCQLNNTVSIGFLRHFWAFLSRSLSVPQLSDSARCDEEGSVDTQQCACLLPGKKTHTPITRRTGSFKLYMSAAENVLWL